MTPRLKQIQERVEKATHCQNWELMGEMLQFIESQAKEIAALREAVGFLSYSYEQHKSALGPADALAKAREEIW